MTIRKSLYTGMIFGAIAPFLGFFAGLQVAPMIGNILIFPFIIMSEILGQPLGEMSTMGLIISFIGSVMCWGLIFISAVYLMGKVRGK